MRISFVVVALALWPVSFARGDDAKDQKAMEGTWLMETAEISGNKFPDELRKATKLVMKGSKYTLTVGNMPDKGTVKIDSSATPKTMDITGTDGPNKGKTIPCIYELDGDTLKVCYNLGGKDRPTEFKTTAESKYFLVTFKRAKK